LVRAHALIRLRSLPLHGGIRHLLLVLSGPHIGHQEVLREKLVLLRKEGKLLLLILHLHYLLLVIVHIGWAAVVLRSHEELIVVHIRGDWGLVVVPTLRVDLVLVGGITCAGIARVSLPRVLYACRGGTDCFFGVDFPLVSGVLLASLHLLRVRTRLTLLKIFAFVFFFVTTRLSLRISGLKDRIL
jgi:hypothetical protein